MQSEKSVKIIDDRNPILNNPYEEPKLHYATNASGNLDYENIKEGRRRFTGKESPAPTNAGTTDLFDSDDIYDEDETARQINRIREYVKEWRENDYPHTTRTTKELLHFWFDNEERENIKRLFFCQREAVETAIWLNEVAPEDPNQGRPILHEIEEKLITVAGSQEESLPRTAFKMATGTGKTVVMAMLILYHYINKKTNPQDKRFADNFLLVAPGITIRDRLGVLRIDTNSGSASEKEDYYHKRGLIPRQYERLMGGLNSSIRITNYQQFLPKEYEGKHASPIRKYKTNKSGKKEVEKDLEDYQSVLTRILGKGMKGKRIVVINDEAHHCYMYNPNPTKGKQKKVNEDPDDNDDTKIEKERAKVWYEGLRQMKMKGYTVQNIYDLSATPYYLKGSGYEPYTLFPWIVSDFGLIDAIESGLVKIPFLPNSDSSHSTDDPKLLNIYEHIRTELPKKGQKAAKKESTEPQYETQPKLPTLLNNALEQFVKDYERYANGERQDEEQERDLFSTPPVFIAVCNNTTVSKEVYKYLSGWETIDAEGGRRFVPGHFDIFSNYDQNGMPKAKRVSLLIDSNAIDDAKDTIDDEFKNTFKEEIEAFKREYAVMYGAGSADALKDGDILREMVNTVGKPGKLGANIRCVVSVSMLTEGWDANTVTHIVGVRAFGSQLLCEQVAGRALRRMRYELLPYDKDGNQLTESEARRRKKENVVWKFPPEYAHIIGVPFKTFKGGQGTTPPPPEQNLIKALPERADLYEITFPNIEGYKTEDEAESITPDFSGCSKYIMDLNAVPEKTELRTVIDSEDKTVVLKSYYEDKRDATVVYELTRRLIRNKYHDEVNGTKFQMFGGLRNIVKEWYDTMLEVRGGNGDPAQKRLILLWAEDEVCNSIHECIKIATTDKEKIKGILNHYNPEGSTRYVWGLTTKPIYETKKSHINCAVCDTMQWEQIAVKILEDMPEVKRYVKNNFLDFKIPYMDGVKSRNYYPDFITVLETATGEEVNLVIEISGFSDDETGNKSLKREYTENYWIHAANNLKKYGRWAFIEITDVMDMRAVMKKKIEELSKN